MFCEDAAEERRTAVRPAKQTDAPDSKGGAGPLCGIHSDGTGTTGIEQGSQETDSEAKSGEYQSYRVQDASF